MKQWDGGVIVQENGENGFGWKKFNVHLQRCNCMVSCGSVVFSEL